MNRNYKTPQDFDSIDDLALFEAHEIESAMACVEDFEYYQRLDENF